ncbi:C4-dicarboxylate ABC transporter substrate-binding protein [Rhodococcus sp. NPDC060086]|uniref:C4-dicarboxylate ABC transporter substrate-binding protein n=1 Tax=Rhodococcus sp. NPDC060086 TaxID=3347055 RepID=UPI0036584A05
MRFRSVACAIASVTAGATVLAACAESAGTGGQGGGAGVEYGASIEEYQEAFESVDPIVIHTQSPAAKGASGGQHIENYARAVSEWSDGKITFDIVYSNGVASPTESDNAVQDGRLDLAQVMGAYEPQEYPATFALNNASVLSDNSVIVGSLSSNAWPVDVAFSTPEIVSEFEDHDLKMLLPSFNSGSIALICTQARNDLAELQGQSIASGSATLGTQVGALGGNPVSIGYTEYYESLQRGVAACAATTLTAGMIAGIMEVAPHVVIDPDAGFANTSGALAMNIDVWEELPVVAQQLMWDRLDVFIEGSMNKIWEGTVDASATITQFDGSAEPFADDARDALITKNETIVDDLAETAPGGAEFVSRARDASEQWKTTVAELGYENAVDYAGFAEWYSPEKLDTTAFVDALFAEVLLEHRPS